MSDSPEKPPIGPSAVVQDGAASDVSDRTSDIFFAGSHWRCHVGLGLRVRVRVNEHLEAHRNLHFLRF